MSKITVIDGFLDVNDFNELVSFVAGPKFPWFYIDTVSLPSEDGKKIKDPMAVETSGLSHVMFDQDWDAKSYTYNFFQTFFKELDNKLGFKETDIIRARASLKWPKVGYTPDNYSLPHVDYYYPHETLIFYLNNSDGDTFIFDQHFVDTGDDSKDIPSVYSIQQRITPKANRLVWIDGLHFHTASNPISTDKRIILNINLKKKL